jgi:hypothetical protein
MLKVVEVRDVIAFELKPGVVLCARRQDMFDILEAPASAAASASATISSGVIGKCGDMVGVWIAPVTAQVMMTFRDFAMSRPSLGEQQMICPYLAVNR